MAQDLIKGKIFLVRPIYSGWGWNESIIEEGFDVLHEDITKMFDTLRKETNLRFDGLQTYWESKFRTWELDQCVSEN